MSMREVVIVDNLVKRYGRTEVLKGLSFKVEEGTIFGILGPNGAGKTTLLRILSTLVGYDEGKIRILDYEIPEESSNIRSRIGFVPENFVFYDKLTVEENLKAFYLLYGRNEGKKVNSFIEVVLKDFGMMDKRNEIAGKLSRGLKQRLNVARSLVNDPELILLDEPFLGLDLYTVKKLREVLLKEKEKGKTVILTSHLVDEMVRICDVIMILKDGRIVEIGKTSELIERYHAEDFEEVFFKLTES
ncbi:MAG: ABC transporter ATP-binding protein [Thermotogae bacterium]|nr:ABC transporter ATP-binding protein [Thermotogota bacterium]